MKKSELKDFVIAAFNAVPYPGDSNLGDPAGRDDSENVTELFHGRDWQSLDSGELWPDALSWMTPEAYLYYFPAYLLAAIEKNSGEIFDAVIRKVTPPVVDDQFVKFNALYSNFTRDQKNAVQSFLRFLLDTSVTRRVKRNVPRDAEEIELGRLLDCWLKM